MSSPQRAAPTSAAIVGKPEPELWLQAKGVQRGRGVRGVRGSVAAKSAKRRFSQSTLSKVRSATNNSHIYRKQNKTLISLNR